MRTPKATTISERIILSKAISLGYSGYTAICDKCGFKKSTFWVYRKNDDFPLSWIRSMDSLLGFTDEEIISLVRGK